MKVGDLVRRRFLFDSWLDDNPWMTVNADNEIGVIVKENKDLRLIKVYWSGQYFSTHTKEDLENVINNQGNKHE